MPKPAVRVHRNAALKIKKEPTPKPPNMPHHNLPEPYARMLNMDEKEPDETFEKIAEELKAGNADKAVQKLIEMALDESYYEYYHDYPDYDDYLKRETRMMMPTHAVHVLTYMGAAGLAAMEPLLPLLNCEDDFQREELPIFYGAMGEAAIEPLIGVLKEGNSEEYLRGGAGEGLVAIAEAHPELRDRVVGILENALANEKEDDELNGFLICNLLDLKAVESYLIIEKAYEDDLVDESIVGLRDVQEHFGLPMTAEDSGIRWVHESELHKPDPALPYQSALDDDEEPAAQPYVAAEKPGRNDPCHCGSGKKYKKCHGA